MIGVLILDGSFSFSIDGHNMTIIEADGVETEPLTVDSLNIFAGECLQTRQYFL